VRVAKVTKAFAHIRTRVGEGYLLTVKRWSDPEESTRGTATASALRGSQTTQSSPGVHAIERLATLGKAPVGRLNDGVARLLPVRFDHCQSPSAPTTNRLN
jgi:hypothetical protein